MKGKTKTRQGICTNCTTTFNTESTSEYTCSCGERWRLLINPDDDSKLLLKMTTRAMSLTRVSCGLGDCKMEFYGKAARKRHVRECHRV